MIALIGVAVARHGVHGDDRRPYTTVLVGAAAVVLGEYTMARVLLKQTLPAFMAQYQSNEPQGGMALALAALVGTTVLFAVLSLLTRPRRTRSSDVPDAPVTPLVMS